MSAFPDPLAPLDPLSNRASTGIATGWSHGYSTAWAVLLIVLGIIAVILPNIAGLALTLYFGWLLVLAGCALFFFAWRTHASGVRWFQVILGALYALIGIDLILHPGAGLVTLTVLLAAYFFIEGAIELVVAWRVQPRAGRGWLIVDAIIAFAVAIAIISAWPSSSAWAIGTLVGINMIFGGFSRLMVTGAVRRHVGLLGV